MTTPNPRKIARRNPPGFEASEMRCVESEFMRSNLESGRPVLSVPTCCKQYRVRSPVDRVLQANLPRIDYEPTALAITATVTRVAPAAFSTRAISFAVAPVVITSSTTKMCRSAIFESTAPRSISGKHSFF